MNVTSGCIPGAAIALVAVPLLATAPRAAILHVEADGTGEYPTIQAAMDAATAGDTVLLGPGTYMDVVSGALEGANARSVAFLKSGVILESSGGADATIIDGQADHHCLVGEFLDTSTEVRGITFYRGHSSGGSGNAKWGGGVLVIDAGPLFEGNVFRDCWAVGGGGFLSRRPFNGDGPTMRDNVFLDNNADDLGGGLELSFVPTFVVEGNTFVRNHCYNQGGGGLLVNASQGVVNRNIFWANTSAGGGGGVSNIGGPGTNVTGSCNVFWENVGGAAPHVDNVYIVTGTDGNVVADPLFCDPFHDDFHLQMASPAAPAHSGGCNLIGALSVGCGPVSVEPSSWGKIKASYR